MKRELFILRITIVFLITAGFSMLPAQIGLDMGLKVGANLAQIEANNLDEGTVVEPLQAYMGGLFLRLNLLSILSVQPEINYMQKGSIFNTANNEKSTFMLNYVEVPVLVKLNILSILGFLKGGIYGGVAYAKLLDAKIRYEEGENATEMDIKDWYNEREDSYVGGVEVQLNLGALHMVVDGRVTISQKNILVPELESEAKNKVYTLGVGFVF